MLNLRLCGAWQSGVARPIYTGDSVAWLSQDPDTLNMLQCGATELWTQSGWCAPGLKLIKPAPAGDEIGYGVAVAIHDHLGVIKGYIKALTLPMIHPHDQHFLHPDHDVGLA